MADKRGFLLLMEVSKICTAVNGGLRELGRRGEGMDAVGAPTLSGDGGWDEPGGSTLGAGLLLSTAPSPAASAAPRESQWARLSGCPHARGKDFEPRRGRKALSPHVCHEVPVAMGEGSGWGGSDQVLKHPGSHGAEERLLVDSEKHIQSELLTLVCALQGKVGIYRRCPVICSKFYCKVEDKFEKVGCILPVKVWSKTERFQSWTSDFLFQFFLNNYSKVKKGCGKQYRYVWFLCYIFMNSWEQWKVSHT